MEESRKLDRTWLCSIVFSDIVNYSSQSVELQMKWKQYFNEVLSEALRSVPVDDRIVLDTGDGAAICFLGEPEVALLTTLSIRCAFVDQVAKDDGSPTIRLGINLGPVKLVRDINGNLNALGDGINVGQRVMSFAAPNQVLVSQSFFEVVSRLSDDYKPLFRYGGVHKDKHVREHVVYELSPSGTAVATAATQSISEESSTNTAESRTVAHRRSLVWVGGLGALLLVVIVAVIVLRSTPPANSRNERTVSQVQQPSPPSTVAVTPADGANPARPTEAPRANTAKPADETRTGAPRRPSAAASTPSSVVERPAVPQPVVDLNGRWQAEVKYGWGDTHPEVMNLKVDDGEVFGTASYVRTPRAIMDGKVEGTKITFTTKSQTMLGDKMYEEKHFYRGRVSGDTIEFILQTDSGYDSRSPEIFTARRAPAAGQ